MKMKHSCNTYAQGDENPALPSLCWERPFRMKNNISCSLLFYITVCLFTGCTKQNKEQQQAENIIYFDSKKCIEDFDLKDYTDGTFKIIPLETTDNSLISTIEKIEIRNNHIYTMDRLAQSVYIFDMEGKYSGKINAIGQGPGEYVNLSYMTVTDSSVIVLDHLFGKQIEYSLSSLKFIREERIFEKIWATEIFTLPGHIYYVNNRSDSRSGKFRLFSQENDTKNFNKYLPFEEDPLSLGINGPVYAITGNEVSIIYSGDDFIYRLKDGKAFPEYEVKFKDKKVVYSSGKTENVFNDNPPGRVIGINAINESDKYLFIDINMTVNEDIPWGPGNQDYTCLYNKSDHTTIVYPRYAINSLFDNEEISVRRIIDNKIINWREASTLLIQKEYLYSERTFKNKLFENHLKNILSTLKEDDNPVLFIYGLK
jgi:hypothetical protein